MAISSRAKISLEVTKEGNGKYRWVVRRGASAIALSIETYARSDAARRSLRHVIKKVAPLVGVTVRSTRTPR